MKKITQEVTQNEKNCLIQILSHSETRNNKDINRLMKISFDAASKFESFDVFMQFIKLQLLDL